MARELEKIRIPDLGSVMAYRGVWALCDVVEIDKATHQYSLRVSHYATCLVGGPQPMWGMWLASGIFQRFFGSKEQINHTKPFSTLIWRRMSATWQMIDIDQKYVDGDKKKGVLKKLYQKGELLPGSEPVAALLEDGSIVPWNARRGKHRPLHAGKEVDPEAVSA